MSNESENAAEKPSEQSIVHTPMTDAQMVHSRCGVFESDGRIDHWVVTAKFAKTLEIENAILKDAMRKIASLRYENAAVNFAAYQATIMAKLALSKVECLDQPSRRGWASIAKDIFGGLG